MISIGLQSLLSDGPGSQYRPQAVRKGEIMPKGRTSFRLSGLCINFGRSRPEARLIQHKDSNHGCQEHSYKSKDKERICLKKSCFVLAASGLWHVVTCVRCTLTANSQLLITAEPPTPNLNLASLSDNCGNKTFENNNLTLVTTNGFPSIVRYEALPAGTFIANT